MGVSGISSVPGGSAGGPSSPSSGDPVQPGAPAEQDPTRDDAVPHPGTADPAPAPAADDGLPVGTAADGADLPAAGTGSEPTYGPAPDGHLSTEGPGPAPDDVASPAEERADVAEPEPEPDTPAAAALPAEVGTPEEHSGPPAAVQQRVEPQDTAVEAPPSAPMPAAVDGPALQDPAPVEPAGTAPAEPVRADTDETPAEPVPPVEPVEPVGSWAGPDEPVGSWAGPVAPPADLLAPAAERLRTATPALPYPSAGPADGPSPQAPVPARRPRPGPAAAPAPSPRPGPAPARPTRAATRAAAAAAARRGGRAQGASAAAAGPRRRRLWPVLLAAVLAVAVLGAGAAWRLGLLGDRTDAPVAEQVPDAVLPELAEPAPALTELSAQAPSPDPAVLAGTLTPLLAAPALGSGLSAQVVDVATGTVLFDRAGQDPGTPASTAKLLTGLAALTALDPESRLTTTVVAGAVPGEVVLVGGGDPTLSTTEPPGSYAGAATVADLAGQVRAQLAGAPVSRVVVDGSLFSGPLTAPGWQPDDAPSTYAAPVTAAAVDGARVAPTSSQRSGRPGTDAGTALAAALGAPSADVVLGAAPPGARVLGTVQSAPVRRLVEQALTESDNLLAESLARHVALARGLPATFAGAAEAVTGAVADAGLDPTGLSLVDASGLSDQDRVPARLLVDVVRAASNGSVPAADGMLAGLPVAGYTGTLADRTADGAGPGAVRAKTGTLLSVHDLAGTVLTADGRLLAFAVLADGTAGSATASETALDEVAAALAGCGCR